MYNNTKKNYGKIYRNNDKDIVCSERFLLISTKVLTGESAMSKIKSELKIFRKFKTWRSML